MSGASETTTATANGVVHPPPPPRPLLPGTTTNGRKRGGTSTSTSTSAAATVTPSSSLASLGGINGSNGHGAGAAGVDEDLSSRTPAHAYARAAAASSVIGDGGDDEDYDDESDVESSSSRRRRRRRTPQTEPQDVGEAMEYEEDGKLPARAKAMDTDSDGERLELGVRRIEVSRQESKERDEEDGKPPARREGGAVATNGVLHNASSSASAAASTSVDDPRNEVMIQPSPAQAENELDGKPLAKGSEATNGGHHKSPAAKVIHRRHRSSSRKRAAPASTPVVRIVSATYGPEDGRRLLNGDVVSEADRSTTLPNRRDVSPVLRALLIAHDERRRAKDEENTGVDWSIPSDCCASTYGYEEDGIGGGIAIMDGKSMNVVFGDPCPGTTKRLDVTYVFDPPSAVVVSSKEDGDGGGKPAAKPMQGDNDDETEDDEDEKTQLCRSSFAEHERVVLRRRMTTRAAFSSGNGEDPKDSRTASAGGDAEGRQRGSSTWRLCPGTSEIVLPIVLPYLDLRHRVLCSEVCVTWRRVVSDWGVARRVDVSDPSFSKYVDARRFLRGVIKSSYGSLRSLFLNNYTQLERDDFEAAVPHLRMLRTLDVSRCRNLTDDTMTLVAEHLGGTLEVLYVKGLRKVGDVGIVAVSEGCPRLRVLEISQVPVTDVGGVAIGTNLLRLEALYMRDNFKLTNRSVDVITSRCDRLEQLTLWGCTRLRGLRFEEDENVDVRAGMRNVALLNLWGCHGLRDDAALGMASLHNLRILIASECHQLSDEFVVNLVRTVPHIQHLHLRYLRRITDAAVDTVATGMPDLRTLDLSFCTTVTASSLANLLDLRRRTLSELRLYSCRRLGDDGRGLLRLAGAVGRDSVLDVLDLRGCHVGGDDDGRDRWGGPDGVGPDVVRRLTSPSAAAALEFTQPLPGFFVRPAVWNGEVRRRLVGQVDAGRFR